MKKMADLALKLELWSFIPLLYMAELMGITNKEADEDANSLLLETSRLEMSMIAPIKEISLE